MNATTFVGEKSYISFDDLKKNYDVHLVLDDHVSLNNLPQDITYENNNDVDTHVFGVCDEQHKENATHHVNASNKKRSNKKHDSKTHINKKQKLDLVTNIENNELLEKLKTKTLTPIKSSKHLDATEKSNSTIKITKRDQLKAKKQRINEKTNEKTRVPLVDEVLNELIDGFSDPSSADYHETNLLQLQKWSTQSFKLMKSPIITKKIISVSKNNKILVHHEDQLSVDIHQEHEQQQVFTHTYPEFTRQAQQFQTFDEDYLNFNSAFSILKHV